MEDPAVTIANLQAEVERLRAEKEELERDLAQALLALESHATS